MSVRGNGDNDPFFEEKDDDGDGSNASLTWEDGVNHWETAVTEEYKNSCEHRPPTVVENEALYDHLFSDQDSTGDDGSLPSFRDQREEEHEKERGSEDNLLDWKDKIRVIDKRLERLERETTKGNARALSEIELQNSITQSPISRQRSSSSHTWSSSPSRKYLKDVETLLHREGQSKQARPKTPISQRDYHEFDTWSSGPKLVIKDTVTAVRTSLSDREVHRWKDTMYHSPRKISSPHSDRPMHDIKELLHESRQLLNDELSNISPISNNGSPNLKNQSARIDEHVSRVMKRNMDRKSTIHPKEHPIPSPSSSKWPSQRETNRSAQKHMFNTVETNDNQLLIEEESTPRKSSQSPPISTFPEGSPPHFAELFHNGGFDDRKFANVTFDDIVRDMSYTTEYIKTFSPSRKTQSRCLDTTTEPIPSTQITPQRQQKTRPGVPIYSEGDKVNHKKHEIQGLLRELAIGIDPETPPQNARNDPHGHSQSQISDTSSGIQGRIHTFDPSFHGFTRPGSQSPIVRRSTSGKGHMLTAIPYSDVRHLQNPQRNARSGYNHSTVAWYLNLCSSKYNRHSSPKDLNRGDRTKVKWVGFQPSHEKRPSKVRPRAMSPRSMPTWNRIGNNNDLPLSPSKFEFYSKLFDHNS